MAQHKENNALQTVLNDRFGEEISRLLQGVIPLSKHFDKLKYEIPYILQLKSDKQKFIYFGMDHSKEPSLEELNMMENLFPALGCILRTLIW